MSPNSKHLEVRRFGAVVAQGNWPHVLRKFETLPEAFYGDIAGPFLNGLFEWASRTRDADSERLEDVDTGQWTEALYRQWKSEQLAGFAELIERMQQKLPTEPHPAVFSTLGAESLRKMFYLLCDPVRDASVLEVFGIDCSDTAVLAGAIFEGNSQLAHYCLRAGAPVNTAGSTLGLPALAVTSTCPRGEAAECLRLLLQFGVNVDVPHPREDSGWETIREELEIDAHLRDVIQQHERAEVAVHASRGVTTRPRQTKPGL